MVRSSTPVFMLAAVLVTAMPAAAQFNSILGDAPRPPADVPSRAPRNLPANAAPSPQLDPAHGGISPVPPSSGVQTAPLPAPPGTESSDSQPGRAPGSAQPGPQLLPGLPPGQRQPRGIPQPAAGPQPGDEVVTELPTQKIANPGAVFSGLDKITGRITSFDVALNETVQFGALQVTPRACYTRPPTEPPRTDGFVEVDEITLQGEVRRIFTGWMFAASPGLHAVEHPIYDVWLVSCKPAPAAVAASAAAPSSASGASSAGSNPPASAPPSPDSPPAPAQGRTAGKPKR